MKPLTFLSNAARAKDIFAVLAKHGFANLLTQLDPQEGLWKRIIPQPAERRTVWERARLALEELGPTFVKVGQLMSMRPDALPPPLIFELRKLQNRVRPLPSEETRGEERGGAAEEIDEFELGFGETGVGDEGRRHERDDRGTGEHERGGDEETAQVDAVGEDFPHLADGVGFEGGGWERRQVARGGEPDRHGEDGEEEERRVPFEEIDEDETGGDAEHGGEREGGHDDGHAASAAFGRDDVGDDGEDDGTGDTAEGTGGDARDEQKVKRGREGAGERGESEAGVEPEQGAFAVETVDKEAADKTGDGGGESVGGDEVAELGRRDVEHAHEAGTERHHDHKIHDVGELDGGQGEEDSALGGGGANGLRSGGRNGRRHQTRKGCGLRGGATTGGRFKRLVEGRGGLRGAVRTRGATLHHDAGFSGGGVVVSSPSSEAAGSMVSGGRV